MAYAGTQQKCQGDICYSLNIPDATASSGSGDIYLQISGPTSYSWIGLGQGSQMAGAQIFVMYTDGSGSNVTLSPRLGGVGHVQPTYNSDAQVTLLDGSGVSNGQMTANFKCSSCSSWSGGSMDLTASSFGFIFAAKSGSELNSDSLSETITQHSNTYGTFSFSSSAKGGSDANPFVAGSSSSGSSANTVTGSNPSATASSSSSRTSACAQGAKGGTQTSNGDSSTTTTGGYGFPFGTSAPSGFFGHSFPTGGFSKRDTDDDCDDNDINELSAAYTKQQRILVAHGVLASLAFLILFPFGAISMRLMSFPGLVAFHAIFQGLSYLVYLVAFGMGVWMASQMEYVSSSSIHSSSHSLTIRSLPNTTQSLESYSSSCCSCSPSLVYSIIRAIRSTIVAHFGPMVIYGTVELLSLSA